MAKSLRFSHRIAGVRSARFARSAAASGACVLTLLVAACAQSPNRARNAAPAGTPAASQPAATASAAAAQSGAPPEGERTYRETCVACHGEDGKGGQGGGMPLTAVPSVDFVVETVSYGRNNMPSFTGVLTTEQIRAVSDYVLALAKQ